MNIKILARHLLLVFLVFTFAACQQNAFSSGVQGQLEGTVERNLKEYGGGTPVPGTIVGVWYPGKGTWIKGFGFTDLKSKEPMHVENKVRIGSNTKTFVVTVLLQLVDEGKLSLDDTIDKFDIGVKVPNADKITLRQLCNMTSGLFEVYEDKALEKEGDYPLKRWDPRRLITYAANHPPDFAPGKGWHYSNTGYLILGLVIEKVTGNKIEEEIRTRLIEPLHLKDTTFPTEYPGMPCPYAHGYALDGDKNWQDVSVQYSPTLSWAAGVMISNMEDVKKWVKAYVTGTTNSAASQEARLQCVDTHKYKGKFGLGVVCTGGWYGYTGGIAGYNTAAYYLPALDATIIVFVSAKQDEPSPGVANAMVRDITKILFPKNLAF